MACMKRAMFSILGVTLTLKLIDDVEKAMAVVQKHRSNTQYVMVMNLRDSFRLRNGVIQHAVAE